MRRALTLALLLFACDDGGPTAEPAPDLGLPDAAVPDVAVPDAAPDAAPDGPPPDVPPPEPARLVINEVDCRNDWVELLNVGGSIADLADYQVQDPRRRAERLQRLSGTAEVGAFTQVALPFDIYCGDMALVLIGPDGQTDPLEAPLEPGAYTFGRLPDETGDFVSTAPTPGAPNAAFEIPGEALFSDEVHRIELTLAPLSIEAVGNDRSVEADAMITINGEERATGVLAVGRNGRYKRIDQKPTLDIQLREPFDGINAILLDAAPLDPAFLTTALAGEMLRAAGVAAPRTGFAWVVINGEDVGLYIVTEAYDAQFLARNFLSSFHIYAATNSDFRPNHETRFTTVYGPQFQRGDLVDLISYWDVPEGESYIANTADFIDWQQVARAFAADVYVSNRDGYAVRRGEMRAHFDNLGRLSMLPAGLEFSLRDPAAWHNGTGEIFRRCLSDEACRNWYDTQLVEVIEAINQVDWHQRFVVLRDLLRPFAEMDPKRLSSLKMFDADAARIERFLLDRQAESAALVECLATQEDEDGDGRRCDEDCDPSNPDIYVGAREFCSDGIDQSCTGTPDDGVCPDCRPAQLAARTYLICPRPRWWEPAQSLCEQQDAQMITFNTRGEARWLTTEALWRSRRDYWLGYTDREEEGVFAWVDGVERDVPWPWNNGEPNNNGEEGEHCAHIRTDGRWNDSICDTPKGILCALPCEDVDADGDGYSGCGFDCDDNDPNINPDAVEICGDGIDQDCNGAADDECDCVTRFRGPHRYLFCPTRTNYDGARAACQAQGADLIIVDSADENAWAYEQSRRVAYQRWWIGLTDTENEGFYRWWDGRRPDFVAHSRGEPNDAGRNEDCIHFWESRAQWNDIPCGANQGAICEDVCPEGQDEDGDGALRCGDDCDDGDPNIGPGVEEACDGVDQDCDGTVDEGC